MKLVGGANAMETPALNENSGIQTTQLIRYMPDPNGISLVQKLGGWQKFYASPASYVVRALWAWEDLNVTSHLACGMDNREAVPIAGCLTVITDNVLLDITPTQLSENISPVLQTTAGSYSVLITDNTTTGITNYDSVFIATQIAIGGVVLFGLYQCAPDGILTQNGYSVWSIDKLGNLLPAASTSSLPVLPLFTTVSTTTSVSVNLPNHGYVVGNTFPVLVSTAVGGARIYGNYVVQTVKDANNFTINIATPAALSTSGYLNGGQAYYLYSLSQGAIPSGTGYGVGTYGSGGYGTGTPISGALGTNIRAIDWTLDNWGEVLIACPISVNAVQFPVPFQPIYTWDPGAVTATANIIPQAPTVNDGIFVAMPQRQIVAWGSTETGIQDPLLLSWCDVGNYNQWIPTVTNQAGNYRIPTGSKIVGAVQGPQQAIIWTDIDAYSMQYIGPPLVYGFTQIGKGCGLIARKGAAFLNGIGYWMGFSQFYTLSGYGVQPLPCPVWDVVFQNLDQNNLSKIRVAVNSRFNEIQWFYPSLSGGGEVDSYVKYNVVLNVWDFGILGRSAWIDQTVLGPPIGADPSSLYLYQHETSPDADGVAMQPYFQTGYYSLSEGDYQTFVDWVWPDFKWGAYNQAQNATVQISFLVAQYPGDTPILYGPYSVTQATQYFYTRFRGRLVAVKISSSDLGSFWRIGNIRYRFSQDGRI